MSSMAVELLLYAAALVDALADCFGWQFELVSIAGDQ